MVLYKNKYRIAPARLKSWNYGSNAPYFVIICSQQKEAFFGSVVDGEMRLSEIGEIARQEWIKSPIIRADMNMTLGQFVVMPNHFHGIIIIGENEYNRRAALLHEQAAMHGGSTGGNKFGPQSHNLSSIIRGFKSSVTLQARKINPAFGWQARFHDHIIRNERSFEHIQDYIENNPLNWKEDRFYP